MDPFPRYKDAYTYFRMGLVTGIVPKQAVVAWADQAILRDPLPPEELIELSLSGKLPYSQLIRNLSAYQGEANYGLPLDFLLCRAFLALESQPDRAVAIIMGLRLLNQEVYLPMEVRHTLLALEDDLLAFRQGDLLYGELYARLHVFLCRYETFQAQVRQIPEEGG